MPSSLAVSISDRTPAARSPPLSDPANSRFLRPSAIGRIDRSAVFVVDLDRASSTKRPSACQLPLGRTKTGRLWTYVRDGRPYVDQTPPAVCCFYSSIRAIGHFAPSLNKS